MSEDFFYTYNPATQTKVNSYQYASSSQIESSLTNLSRFKKNKHSNREIREILSALELGFQENTEELARLITLEMGKPIVESRAEVQKSILAIQYVRENFEKKIFDEIIQVKDSFGSRTYQICKEPMGIILAIMPWNFPVWQLMRVLPFAVAAGNSVFLKPADNVAGVSKYIEKIVNEVIPDFFACHLLKHKQVEHLISDQRISAVTLTGSTRAGREVARICGQNLKKVVLELGGSDPYIVFSDADIKNAAKTCVQSRLINNGQSCIAAKRFFIEEPAYDAFLEQVKIEIEKYQIGDPSLDQTHLGPLVSEKHKLCLAEQIENLILNGFQKEYSRPLSLSSNFQNGCFFSPTILSYSSDLFFKQKERATAFYKEMQEMELFGPVFWVQSFSKEEEVLAMANSSHYGLGGAVFTHNSARAKKIVTSLESGFVVQNDFVRSHPALPFGGVKQSGFGRELGESGFDEFIHVKVVGLI